MISEVDLLEKLPVAFYMTDAEGRITFYNDAAAELWGQRPPLGSLWCGSFRIYFPDGRVMPHDQCPMAMALKEGCPVRGIPAVAERPDGTRVPFLPYPVPLKDESGKVIGGLNVLIDTSEWKRVETQLAAIVTSSDDAIVSKTLDGTITSWNQGATRIFGYQADEMIGESVMRIIPAELHGEEKEILSKLKRGERIDHYDTVRVAKNGRRVNVSLTVSPLRNASGQVIGAAKIARDISERKDAEKVQQLLLDELNHRVKNTLATVDAIGRQSLLHARNPEDFVASFSGRIQALAKAHSVLTESQMQGAELADLVKEQVLIATSDNRITHSGPRLLLDPQRSIHIALILHELATNARKHGALSTAGGRVSVIWKIQEGATRTLVLEWTESGGPKVPAHRSRGFGISLIEQTARGYGGEASFNFSEDGVNCRIAFPFAEDRRKFRLPQRAERQTDLLLGAKTGESSVLQGKRILVVEDEPLVAMDLKSMLTATGCQVVGPAGSIAEAKVLIEDTNCDAALLDFDLAGDPADELASALARKNTPFAFITGYTRTALPKPLQESVLLAKPFNRDELVSVVETLVYLGNPEDGLNRMRRKMDATE